MFSILAQSASACQYANECFERYTHPKGSSELPLTGFEALVILIIGIAVLCMGVLLRRATRPQ